MGLFRDDQGKTEKPTPTRLADARQKGQVAMSREFVMGGSLVLGVLAIEHLGPWLIASLQGMMVSGLSVADARPRLERGDIPAAIGALLEPVAAVALPFGTLLLIGVAVAALFGYGQVGVKISSEALALKPERLNPIQGFARIFSLSALTRASLSAAKLVVLCAVPAIVLGSEVPRLITMFAASDVTTMVAYAAELALRTMFWIAVPVLALSLIDVVWQRREHIKNLMMTKQEIDDERKRAEGDPIVKRRVRAAALKLARQRMLDSVPKADVIVTNPTHYSVALRYGSGSPAPVVVAKGVDSLAIKIREAAADAGVMIVPDPPLARTLYAGVEVGREIPEDLFHAVAQLLAYVYRVAGQRGSVAA
jgi:flagellar biosynthetic protein FlhB